MKRATKFQILIAYYIVSIIIGIVVVILSTPICLDPECVEKAAFIQGKMGDNVDPCKDFYKFLCGGAPLAIPPELVNFTHNLGNVSNTPFDTESVYNFMVRKVSNYAGAARTGAFSAETMLYHESVLARFFTMCEKAEESLDIATSEDVKIKLQLTVDGTGMTLKEMFHEATFNQSLSVGIYEYRLKMLGFPGRHLFTSTVKRDYMDPEHLALYIGRPVSFQSIARGELKKRTKKEWFESVEAVVKVYAPTSKEGEISNELLYKFVDLWFEISDSLDTVENKNVVRDQPVKLREIQEWFPDLDFAGFLNTMQAGPKSRRYVYIESNSQNYFEVLRKILSKYTRQVKVIYLVVQNIFDVLPFLSFDSHISSMFEGITSLKSQGEICKNMLGNRFGGMILSLIIERFDIQRSPPEAISSVFPIFADVMRRALAKASWMDSPTKQSGYAKLKAIKTQISMSKKQFESVNTPGKRARYYNGLCYQRSILTTLMCMNSFFTVKNFGLFTRESTGFDQADEISMGGITYEQDTNVFHVPIFILRFPAFDNAWPFHINFGGMGIEIAAEITKGFDLKGSRKDKFGLAYPWWTNVTWENYKKREVECSKLMQPLNKTKAAYIKTMNHRNLTNEDIEKGELRKAYWINLVGVKMAYKAYKDFIQTQTATEYKLPGLEGFTTAQNFFLSHACMRCLTPMATEEMKQATRVYFKALSSLKEFKEAFKCSSKPTSRMESVVSKASSRCLLF